MRNADRETVFRFKQFELSNCRSAMKVGTDGVILGAWAFKNVACEGLKTILDVGCGTGLLSLMMAQRFPDAFITGIDIDSDATEEAQANFKNSKWNHRLMGICRDYVGFADNCGGERFDAIICNPPFFTNGAVSPDGSRRTARHEDGSLSLETLFSHADRLLKPGGRMAIVTMAEYRSRVEFLAELNRLRLVAICQVYTKTTKAPRRILCELITPACDNECGQQKKESSLIIHGEGGVLTDEYVGLVSPYYTKI